MPLNTRKRNEYQGTRDMGIGGRQFPRRYTFTPPRPRSDNLKESMDWAEQELETIWLSLRGGGSAKALKYSGNRLSQALDHWGRPTRLYDSGPNEWVEGKALNRIDKESYELWIPATDFIFDASQSPACSEIANLGGSRIAGIAMPDNGSNAMHLWSNQKMPDAWYGSGKTVTWKALYGLSANGIALSVARLGCAAYGYNAGDTLTAPEIQWSEITVPDLSSSVAAEIYTQEATESSSTLTSKEFISVRFNRQSQHASDTYTGSIHFFGLLLTAS